MTKRFLLSLILLAALVLPSAAQVLGTQLVQNNSSGGACTAVANSCASFTLASVTSVTLQVSGTWTGTLTFEATTDGTNWNTVGMKNLATGVDVTTTTANGSFATANVGLVGVRARATAAITGSASVAAARGYASVRSLPFSSAVPVPVGSGGTGLSSYAIGDLIVADGATSLAKLPDVATGSVLASGGVGTAPAWSATPTLTSVTAGTFTGNLTGNASGTAATVTGATQAAITSAANLATVGTITSGVWNAGAVTSSGAVTAGTALFPSGASGSQIKSSSDGVLAVYNNAGTDFGRIQFGGTTSSFPSLKRNGAGIDVRKADDSAYGDFTAGGLIAQGTLWIGTRATIVNVAPSSITSCGGGTAPSFAWTNGTAAFEIITGSSTPVATCTWTMPAATNKWVCHATDITTQSTSVFMMKQTAGTTTSVTVTNYNTAGAATAVVASDHLLVSCLGG